MNANGFKNSSMTVLTVGSVSDKTCRYASSIMVPASPRHAGAKRKNGHKQVSLIITESHQGSRRKTKHGLPTVNGNAEERYIG